MDHFRDSPDLDEKALKALLDGFDVLREQDPLAVLQEGSLDGGKGGGQLTPFKMAPNFEITMYLAQATGSCIVTDSAFRWRELVTAAARGTQGAPPLTKLRASIEQADLVVPRNVQEITELAKRWRALEAIQPLCESSSSIFQRFRQGAQSPISKPASMRNSRVTMPQQCRLQRSLALTCRECGYHAFGPPAASRTIPSIGSF